METGGDAMISRMLGPLIGMAIVAATSAVAAAQTGGKGSGGPNTATATFAGGCFWCMEAPFDKLDGVASVTVGYTGGRKVDPTYQEVSAGTTGHAEAVQIVYDPAKIEYQKLLEVFWRNIDPLTPNAQFCDHGSQYRSAIFYHDETQKRMAEACK